MAVTWLASTSQGYMVGDCISTSVAGGTAHGVFAVANAPGGSTLDEAMYSPAAGLAAVTGSAVVTSAGRAPRPQRCVGPRRTAGTVDAPVALGEGVMVGRGGAGPGRCSDGKVTNASCHICGTPVCPSCSAVTADGLVCRIHARGVPSRRPPVVRHVVSWGPGGFWLFVATAGAITLAAGAVRSDHWAMAAVMIAVVVLLVALNRRRRPRSPR